MMEVKTIPHLMDVRTTTNDGGKFSWSFKMFMLMPYWRCLALEHGDLI